MKSKKKTRYRKPGRAGGITIRDMNPELDHRGKYIYFVNLGKRGGLAFVERHGTKPDNSGDSVGMYPCR